MREGLQVIFNKADIEKVGEKVGEKLSKNQTKILEFMEIDKSISARELAEKIGISTRKIEENIKVLKEMHRIKRIGSDKGGHWEIIS